MLESEFSRSIAGLQRQAQFWQACPPEPNAFLFLLSPLPTYGPSIHFHSPFLSSSCFSCVPPACHLLLSTMPVLTMR